MSSTQRIFTLEVGRETGALERVLGVARRRGLGLEVFSAMPADDSTWKVRIEAAAPDAEAHLAVAQFNALIDVRRAVMEEI